MENALFADEFPIEPSFSGGFPIATFDYQRVDMDKSCYLHHFFMAVMHHVHPIRSPGLGYPANHHRTSPLSKQTVFGAHDNSDVSASFWDYTYIYICIYITQVMCILNIYICTYIYIYLLYRSLQFCDRIRLPHGLSPTAWGIQQKFISFNHHFSWYVMVYQTEPLMFSNKTCVHSDSLWWFVTYLWKITMFHGYINIY